MKKIDKILKYIDDHGITPAEFERKSGISNAYLKNTAIRGADISDKVLDKIKKSNPQDYSNIFPDEGAIVLKGILANGEMILSHAAYLNVLLDEVSSIRAELKGGSPLIERKRIEKAISDMLVILKESHG